MLFRFVIGFYVSLSALLAAVPPLPKDAELALDENWSSGEIDPERWYALRKKWGKGNNGVAPENVSLVKDVLAGKEVTVLQCAANGDKYKGDVVGWQGKPERVGGVLVSKQHFASGRFEVRMKIGTPEQPRPPGMVAAIWTYGYGRAHTDAGFATYSSEIDFPEYGKKGDYLRPMYNTFLNKKHHSMTFDVHGAADGRYHTYVTDWHTALEPIEGVKDEQVVEWKGFHWVRDKAIPFERYLGNPLKRLGKDNYAVCAGVSAKHWIDGKFVGENQKFVPSMTGQLNLGVWLPEWAGAAPWETATVRFASVRVWQFNDPGDVRGILTKDITNNFDAEGAVLKR